MGLLSGLLGVLVGTYISHKLAVQRDEERLKQENENRREEREHDKEIRQKDAEAERKRRDEQWARERRLRDSDRRWKAFSEAHSSCRAILQWWAVARQQIKLNQKAPVPPRGEAVNLVAILARYDVEVTDKAIEAAAALDGISKRYCVTNTFKGGDPEDCVQNQGEWEKVAGWLATYLKDLAK